MVIKYYRDCNTQSCVFSAKTENEMAIWWLLPLYLSLHSQLNALNVKENVSDRDTMIQQIILSLQPELTLWQHLIAKAATGIERKSDIIWNG